jgi:preprotein translocase subunit SecE
MNERRYGTLSGDVTGVVGFVAESWQELTRVSWPSRESRRAHVRAVLVAITAVLAACLVAALLVL